MIDIFTKGFFIGFYRFFNAIKYYILGLSVISFCLNLMVDNLLLVNVLNWIGATSYFLYARFLFRKMALDDFKSDYLIKCEAY